MLGSDRTIQRCSLFGPFDERFLDKHAGSIIGDTAVAIVELVANAWDAYASQVDIVWPDASASQAFSITDNGKGLTPQMFEQRWRKLDYNRISEEGDETAPPAELKNARPRKVHGRNGRGRHAGSRIPIGSGLGATASR